MANTLTPTDVYVLMNDIAYQATGRKDLTAVDTSSFVSVGETLLRTGVENTMNAISTVLAYTIFSVRPYKSSLSSLRVSSQRWGAQIRKITPLAQDFEQSQDWNTQLSPQALANGNSVDMYKINAPQALQLNFYGTKVLQKHITKFRDQLSLAFTSEVEFMRFIDSIMVEFANEVEIGNEVQTRATLINFFAGLQAMGLSVIDLTQVYNTKFGTTYTRDQLLTQHLTEFMQFFVSQVKVTSDRLVDMSAYNHANITGYKPILRHTPKTRQKMIMYGPMFTEAEATVFSEIFNPIYLELGNNFETVNYWQSQEDPTAISATPNILDTATGHSKTAESVVNIPYVVGAIFDEEACGVMPQFNYASTTPFNSAGGYYNMFYHWRFNSYVDYTENAVLFILGDGGAQEA